MHVNHLLDHRDPRLLSGDIYWQVDNYRTVSKIAAFEQAQGDVSRVRFCFMENSWRGLDYSKEPTHTWEELLRIRCQRLRDKYRHLALMYSGGWDSHTILLAFIRNKIPLDEILIWDKRSFMPEPELESAVQTARSLIDQHGLKTKLHVYEIPWNIHGEVFKSAGENWIYLPGAATAFNRTHRIIQQHAMPSFLELRKPGDSVGYIEGVDKPYVFLSHGQWQTYHPDDNMVSYVGCDSVLFYFAPDLPELHVKQVHMSIKWLEQILKTTPKANKQLALELQQWQHPLYPQWNQHIGRECGPNPSAWTGGLKGGMLEGPKKQEMLALLNHTIKHDRQVFDIYWQGLCQIRDLINYDVTENPLPCINSTYRYVRNFQK